MANWNEKFNNASRFWLGDSFSSGYSSTRDYRDKTDGGSGYSSYNNVGWDQNDRVARMMQVHKACANFVKILTGRDDIKVRFSGDGQSFTNGKEVVISANTKEAEFDVTVGLCLHEASHCVLTKFEVANDPSLRSNAELFGILNWIEDRRIDAYVYKNAPGYRDYYEALYNKYFHSPIVDKALLSSHLRDETYESYSFRMGNMMNANSDLKALKHLQTISDLIDLPNIDRLSSTVEVVTLAKKVYEIIKKAEAEMPPPPPPQEQNQEGKSGEGDKSEKGDSKTDSKADSKPDDSKPDKDSKENEGKQPGNSNPDDKSGENEKNEKSDKGEKTDNKDEVKNKTDETPEGKNSGNDGDDSKDSADDSGDASNGSDANNLDDSKPKPVDLTDRQLDELTRAIINQNKFTNAKLETKKIQAADNKLLKDLNEISADVEFIRDTNGKNHPCYMYELNDALLTGTDPHRLFLKGSAVGAYPMAASQYEDAVKDGLSLGAILGNKLKMHDENRELITSHREYGKIDKRLIASLGMGLDRVFYDKQVDRHVPKCIYITVDGSGSMSHVDHSSGMHMTNNEYMKESRFYKAQVAVVAMIKACTMIQSIRIIVDYRYSSDGGIICLRAFDSRKDKISKVTNMFKYLRTLGGTPEGYAMSLPFKKGDIAKGSQNLKSYYINFSDGEPSYNGSVEHTKKVVDDIRKNNVKVMSYYIGGNEVPYTFSVMYGKKDSHAVNVSQLLPLAKSLNKMFMES